MLSVPSYHLAGESLIVPVSFFLVSLGVKRYFHSICSGMSPFPVYNFSLLDAVIFIFR